MFLALAVLATGGARKFAYNKLGDALAESPRHRGLLFAASSDSTQYAYAFVNQASIDRALALSGGKMARPSVALAETVSVHKQDRKEFPALLGQALAIDVNSKPDRRLNNLVTQRRARWLPGRADRLFVG
jgi:hypothetical protein